MEYTRNAKRYLRSFGGLSFLDKVNEDLLTLAYEAVDGGEVLSLGGEEWYPLARGADRIVYHNGTLVIKFPTPTSRWSRDNANEVEFRVYEKLVGTPLAAKFAPSIALLDEFSKGLVLVAVKVKGAHGDPYVYSKYYKMERTLTDALRGFGISAFDIHAMNVIGTKVIDYGRFKLEGMGEE